MVDVAKCPDGNAPSLEQRIALAIERVPFPVGPRGETLMATVQPHVALAVARAVIASMKYDERIIEAARNLHGIMEEFAGTEFLRIEITGTEAAGLIHGAFSELKAALRDGEGGG